MRMSKKLKILGIVIVVVVFLVKLYCEMCSVGVWLVLDILACY